MKKFLLLIGLLLLAAAVILTLRPGAGSQEVVLSRLAPADAAIYLELPSLRESAKRWRQTGLAQIGREPEFVAFLEKPLANLQQLSEATPILDPLLQLDTGSAFLAVTGIDQPLPQLSGGFQFRGGEEALRAALKKIQDYVTQEFPDGQADLQQIDGYNVETYKTENWEIAGVQHGDWYYVANDLAAMEALLKRIDGRSDADSLASNQNYRQCVAKLPETRESLAFLDMRQIGKRLLSLSLASGQTVTPEGVKEMEKVQALAAVTCFEGTSIRDVAFFLMDDADLPQQRLSNAGLELTTQNTVFYYSDLLVLPEKFQLPDPALDQTGLLRPLVSIVEQLKSKGYDAAAFRRAFGPEYSIHADWQKDSQRPIFMISVDVADAALASLIMDELTSGNLGLPPFRKESLANGEQLYSLPSLGTIPVQPAMYLAADRLLISDDADTLRRHSEGISNPTTLADSELYGTAFDRLPEPATACGFLDTREAFSRTYTLLRPTLLLFSAFMPGINQQLDLSKLPATETVAQHLEPVVFSQSIVDNGVLYESRGTLTMNQIIGTAGGAAGIGIAAQALGDIFDKPGP